MTPAKVFLHLALFVSSTCFAQTMNALSQHPDAVRLQGSEYIVPELILGGEWTSSIRLTNRGTNPIPATNVVFYDNTGKPMAATFQTSSGSVITDVGFSFSLNVGGVLEATFFGGSNTLFGQGIILCSAVSCGTPGLYGEVSLRNRNATRPDFESIFPLEQPAATQYMLFDGRNGLTTVLYLVNTNTTSTSIAMDIVDPTTRVIRTISLPMDALSSQIQTLHVLAPETIGIQGTLVFRANNSTGQNASITVTALRINPSNSFTPVRAWVPSQ